LKENPKLQKLLFFCKLVLTAGLCVIIIALADWGDLKAAILNSKPWLLLIVLLGMILNIGICSFKWRILLSINGIKMELSKLFRYYLTGMFFNNFLPGSIGGDGYRIYKTLDKHRPKVASIMAVFLDRLTGMIVLFFVGYAGAIITFIRKDNSISWFGVLFGSAVVALFLIFVVISANERARNWLFHQRRLPEKVKRAAKYFSDAVSSPVKIAQVIGIAFFYHLFLLFYRLLLIQSVGATCSIFALALVIMVSTTVAMVPISINGIGILDGSFIYLIGRFGVPYEEAMMVMILQRALSVGISLAGGIFYLSEKKVVRQENVSLIEPESIGKPV
jgi:hypothetical protein